MISSCQSDGDFYQKKYTSEEKQALAESLLNAAGTDAYYQGSVGERMIILEGMKYDPNNAWGWRELGVPYLKRGMARQAYEYYSKAVKYDPLEWQGYMAYCWLFFYRDYDTAIKHSNGCDAFTNDFVDYPQSTSVDYMRGISYLGKSQIDSALYYLEKHLEFEKESTGIAYIEPVNFAALSQAYLQNNEFDKTIKTLKQGLEYNENTASLHYHLAAALLRKGENNKAKYHLDQAEKLIASEDILKRGYVHEFFTVFQEDVDRLRFFLKNEVKAGKLN